MFDTLILLAGSVERATLPAGLLGHNPHLTVLPVACAEELAALSGEVLGRARLIAFVTPVIVPKTILDQLGYGAFNFHPGPPAYPGWAPAHFALYDRAEEFGATMHVMIERVDAGPIVDVASFPIPPHISVLGLEGLAYANLALLFWRMATWMATDPAMLPTLPIAWGRRKYSQRDYRSMCDIPLEISKDELDRRMRIFGGDHFGISPTIRLHGTEFRAIISSLPAPEAEPVFSEIAKVA